MARVAGAALVGLFEVVDRDGELSVQVEAVWVPAEDGWRRDEGVIVGECEDHVVGC